MKKISDKATLQRVVRKLHDALKSNRIFARHRLVRQPKIVSTDTRGWRANLGRLANRDCDLEVWLDRFTAYDERKFYYGLYAENSGVIRRIQKRVKNVLHNPIIFTSKDLNPTTSYFSSVRQV
jgi:hypothetical protein